jgi:pimeloyl-ACP methyl ester carboxylesterase
VRQIFSFVLRLAPFSLATLMAGAVAAPTPARATLPVAQGIVIVCDGSGDFRTLSTGLARAVLSARMPLYVETFVWSHGYGRYVIDHTDHCNHIEMGRVLAQRVLAYRRAYPGLRLYLAAHSAGNAVALAAAEQLPPDTLDRIILLAPSVSPCYDLRPALASAREGIDAFVSERDRVVLGAAMYMVGTADRRAGPAAGLAGFRPEVSTPSDATLYCRFRQHNWHPAMSWTGHDGGHYGNNRADFLGPYVLPLFLQR